MSFYHAYIYIIRLEYVICPAGIQRQEEMAHKQDKNVDLCDHFVGLLIIGMTSNSSFLTSDPTTGESFPDNGRRFPRLINPSMLNTF